MFPETEYQARRARVREAMRGHQASALVVTGPEDVYYLSGLNSQGHFVFTALVLDADSERVTVVAREMERPTVVAQAPACAFAGYGDGDDPADVLAEVVGRPPRHHQRAIGYEANSLSFPAGTWRALDRRLASPWWIDCTGMLTDVRAQRSDREVAHLRDAARMSDTGMQAGIAAVREDGTGGEIVGAIQHAMLAAGSDYPGFVPLVRSVEQIEQEHVAWTSRRISSRDTLFFELSAASARYHAPLGRTVRPAGRSARGRASDLSRAGLETIVAGLRPGRTMDAVYREWNTVIESGLGHPYPRHHCGYLVGIGFPPSWMAGRVDSLRPGNLMELRRGMTFHVQSWVVDATIGVCATSDTALVTEDGSELLTATPHEL